MFSSKACFCVRPQVHSVCRAKIRLPHQQDAGQRHSTDSSGVLNNAMTLKGSAPEDTRLPVLCVCNLDGEAEKAFKTTHIS